MSAFFDALKAERKRLLPFADTEKLAMLEREAHDRQEQKEIADNERSYGRMTAEQATDARKAAYAAEHAFDRYKIEHRDAMARIREIDAALNAQSNYDTAAQDYRATAKALKAEVARGEQLSALIAEMEGEVAALLEESSRLTAEHADAQIKSRLEGSPAPTVPKRAAQAHIDAESRRAALEKLRDMHRDSIATVASMRNDLDNKKHNALHCRSELASAAYFSALEGLRELATQYTAARWLAGFLGYNQEKPPAIEVGGAEAEAARTAILDELAQEKPLALMVSDTAAEAARTPITDEPSKKQAGE